MRTLVLTLWAVSLALPVSAADVRPPVDRRFAAETAEVPDFQRHVLPLLGRLGCNGRACHGSFQGQGGFRLSLFGYDFATDHEALTAGETPRVDRKAPQNSLILRKPTLAIDHDGGELFQPGGWEHRLLLGWVEAGAPGISDQESQLITLHIEPREIVFRRPGQTAQLKIVAEWSDGTLEDVTPLSRFRTNDESIAEISDSGRVTAVGGGDTHVVAFYDNGITPVSVILPVSDRTGPNYPPVPTPTQIDELVVEKLRKVGIVPSEVCTDGEFLRRVSLDMTGTLPRPDEVAAFLADPRPDKRARKIDELLQRPTYAAWWATRFGDFLGISERNHPVGGEQSMGRQKSEQSYDWLCRRIDENRPYDEIAAGIVLAVSRRPEQSLEEYFEEMTAYFREQDRADFSLRETMPYFWASGRFSPPTTLRFSYAFLGVRLECAECHKHPYDQWTKEDYEGFQAFFEGVRFRYPRSGPVSEIKQTLGLTGDQDSGAYKRRFAQLAAQGAVLPWGEVSVPSWQSKRSRLDQQRRKAPTGRVISPRLLGGEEVLAEQYNDPREPVMEWLREQDNPYFTRVLINRIWANYFGVGIVDPPDDQNLANPPSNGPLLDYLAEAFVASGYDLKWLHREITNSRTYQLSWRLNETNELDERNFSRAQVRRLPAEVTYDALVLATAADDAIRAMHDDRATVRERAIGVTSGYSGSYALRLFGKPTRNEVCDCQRSDEPSLLQTVYFRNDAELLALLDRRDGWLRQLAPRGHESIASRQDELIRETFLRTLSRFPTENELAAAREHIAEADGTVSGLKDLLWALLNTKEFVLNH